MPIRAIEDLWLGIARSIGFGLGPSGGIQLARGSEPGFETQPRLVWGIENPRFAKVKGKSGGIVEGWQDRSVHLDVRVDNCQAIWYKAREVIVYCEAFDHSLNKAII